MVLQGNEKLAAIRPELQVELGRQPEKKVISPGESVDIKTVFNSAGKLGNQNKTVTIITNDPKKSKMILWVKGEVLKAS